MSDFLNIFTLEDEAAKSLQNSGKRLSIDGASHARRTRFRGTPLRNPEKYQLN
jgi:hypothetical protein